MALLEVAGGAVIGWVLAELSSRRARREERAYLRGEQARERQLEAVQVLNDALREANGGSQRLAVRASLRLRRFWKLTTHGRMATSAHPA